MALASRSSLRSLVLLVSHGKPQLSSFFFSSAAATRGVPPAIPGADTPPAAPAVQLPAPPDPSRPKLPKARRTHPEETVLHPIPGGPRPRPRPRPPRAVKDVADKAYLNAPEDPSSAHPTPDHGSSSTPEPVSHKPPLHIFEDPRHRLVDPPRGRPPRAVKSVADKAYLDASEDPSTHPAPDNGSRSAPEPVSDGTFEDPRHPVPDPSGRGRKAVTDEPGQRTEERPKYYYYPDPDSSTDKGPVEEHPAYTTPGYGSCSTPEPVPDEPPHGTSEDVKQRHVNPPPPAREGVGYRVVDPPGRGRSALPDEPEQCTQEHPKYPALDSSK